MSAVSNMVTIDLTGTPSLAAGDAILVNFLDISSLATVSVPFQKTTEGTLNYGMAFTDSNGVDRSAELVRSTSDGDFMLTYDASKFVLAGCGVDFTLTNPTQFPVSVFSSGTSSSGFVDLSPVLSAISALDGKISVLPIESLNGNGSRYKDGESLKVTGLLGDFVVDASFMCRVNANSYTVMCKLTSDGKTHYIPESLLYSANEVAA